MLTNNEETLGEIAQRFEGLMSEVIANAGTILKNSIKVSEAYPRNKQSNGTDFYLGVAETTSGRTAYAMFYVNRVNKKLEEVKVVHAKKQHQKPGAFAIKVAWY